MRKAGVADECRPHISPSKKIGFGDYQANGAMAAAKKMGKNPRELAQLIIEQLDIDSIAEKIEVAGPGFINIHLRDDWLAQQLVHLRKAPTQTIKTQTTPTLVGVYSAPNPPK